jgi:hypothetical protein
VSIHGGGRVEQFDASSMLSALLRPRSQEAYQYRPHLTAPFQVLPMHYVADWGCGASVRVTSRQTDRW